MSHFLVYVWLKLDSLRLLFNFLFLLSMFICFLLGYVFLFEEEYRSRTKSYLKWFALASLLLLLIKTWLPSTKEFAVIYLLPKVADSEIVDDGSESIQFLLRYFKAYLQEKITELETDQND